MWARVVKTAGQSIGKYPLSIYWLLALGGGIGGPGDPGVFNPVAAYAYLRNTDPKREPN